MMRSFAVLVAAALLLGALAAPAIANGAGSTRPAQPVQPAQPTQPSALQPQPAQTGMGPMTQCTVSALGIDSNSVYVLRGDQLLKLNKSGMTSAACVTLPAVSASAMASVASPSATGAGPSTDQSVMCPMANIAVDNNNVYVMRGNEILTLDKNSLQIISTTTLPAMAAAPAVVGAGPEVAQAPLATTAEAQQLVARMQTMQPTQLEQTYMQTIFDSHANAIAWSRLAQTKATRPELQQFAAHVISDEQRINSQWSGWYSQWYNTTPKAQLTPMGQQTLDKLQGLSGTQFDIAYLQALEQHFSNAIALSQVAAQNAQHAQLKQAAANMAQQHVSDLNQVRTWLQQWYNVQPRGPAM